MKEFKQTFASLRIKNLNLIALESFILFLHVEFSDLDHVYSYRLKNIGFPNLQWVRVNLHWSFAFSEHEPSAVQSILNKIPEKKTL